MASRADHVAALERLFRDIQPSRRAHAGALWDRLGVEAWDVLAANFPSVSARN